jgi:magnesium-transporting ATPase (P-type)
MNTTPHCSFRTFWLGFCDWFASRTAMTAGEAFQEAREEHGTFFPLKLLWLGISVVFLLIATVALLPFFVQQTTSAGATTEHVLWVSEWGTVLVVSGLAGIFVVSKAIKISRFCRQMCERGQRIEAARAQARNTGRNSR